MPGQPEVSIVIACYNDAGYLEESVKEVLKVMDATRYQYEIIFIDDASSDGTQDIIVRLCGNYKIMSYLFHAANQGRGSAVADGIRQAQGAVVGFIDIDLETHARYIPALIAEILAGADVASAWRIYKTRLLSFDRWILNRGYNFLVRHYLGLNFRDTETGCKFFKKDTILPVLSQIKERHWFWDTEIIARAYLKGLKIVEIPTLYIRKSGKKSSVKAFKDVKYYLKKLFWFRQELKKLS